MACNKRIVIALGRLWEARQPAVLPQGIEPVSASCDDLVCVALMTDVKNEPVFFRVVYSVDRNGKLYSPEVR